MEGAHYWYYMLELGFYISLLLRISVDIKRKVNLNICPLSCLKQQVPSWVLARSLHNIFIKVSASFSSQP